MQRPIDVQRLVTLSLRCLLLTHVAFACSVRARADEPLAKTEPPRRLFDGKTLQGWKVTEFGGQGDVYVEDGQLILGFGSSLTGVTYEKPLPVIEYEVQLEAKRLDGTDFFCGLTFPVNDAHCTLIVGGWGGALVGLSSLDGQDASENETQRSMRFARDRWYQVRLRVQKERITVWIDGKQLIDVPTKGRKISIRPEVELSRPFGICAWETRAAIRKITLRELSPHQD